MTRTQRAEPAKVGTIPTLIIRDTSTPWGLGDEVKFKELLPNGGFSTKWSTGKVRGTLETSPVWFIERW
jgi:hypothetical protein